MNWQERDKASIWHPYTQHQIQPAPIPIVKAEGLWLHAEDGTRYLDAISSWWVTLHGHAHPYIAQKVGEQLKTLEQVIFAGFTHPPAVLLAERLLALLPEDQKKVFYSDNGSTAVEVALKMALQYWFHQGQNRRKILAFKEAYHGDTFGAMAVSGRSAFTRPFDRLLFDVVFIDLPTAENIQTIKEIIKKEASDLAAFIFEPLVQGSAGMRMYEARYLDELLAACQEEQILCIADEVMTGFGRTGELFACRYLQEKPDIYCFSKGLTGGTMALGITTCRDELFNSFLSEDRLKTFFHGHSFTANPLACTAALASMDLLLDPVCEQQIEMIARNHRLFAQKMASHSNVKNARSLGTILALDIVQEGEATSYFNSIRDRMASFFIQRHILLRPLGNVLYILPPYCITEQELEQVYAAIHDFLQNSD